MVRIRGLILVFCLCFSFAFIHAQSQDWHLSSDGASTFFLRCPFAHGYMHGYEEGFHRGDLDLQMGRSFQALKKQDGFKKIVGYRKEFGDRNSFDEGYRKGYAVGYTDSYAGRNFRAIQLVEQARADLFLDKAPQRDVQFDEAFVAGYATGQKTGLQDGRAAAGLATLDSIGCSIVPRSPEQKSDICAAYRGGYRVGYSDGYANQDKGGLFARK